MTTHVTPIVKPEQREVHVHLLLSEATMLGLALGSILATMILPDEWKALLTQLADDSRAATETITKG